MYQEMEYRGRESKNVRIIPIDKNGGDWSASRSHDFTPSKI